MSAEENTRREGSLEAPIRHPLGQDQDEFYDENALAKELDRVFDICHGCRRCFNLCHSFPILFDAIDETDSGELEGIENTRSVYDQVVTNCFQCDMCYQTKCPYVPPHEWNIDFPHLMLRAKAIKFKKHKDSIKLRDRIITSTDMIAKVASLPGVASAVNKANKNSAFRKILHKTLAVHPDAPLPEYHSNTLKKRLANRPNTQINTQSSTYTTGKVALFATCYGNYNEPQMGEDLVAVFEHNKIAVELIGQTQCCGMPKFDLGDLDSVTKAKEHNIPILKRYIEQGYDIVAPIPSCALMFKQELPLMFSDDADVLLVKEKIFDPFEYLMLRHKEKLLNTEFKQSLGKISYHVACHLRVQNIGYKTRDILQLIPDTKVLPIERCSGHDGTYTVKSETHEMAMKICKPVVSRVQQNDADYYTSDCTMAGHHISAGLKDSSEPTHPLSLLRLAYGI